MIFRKTAHPWFRYAGIEVPVLDHIYIVQVQFCSGSGKIILQIEGAKVLSKGSVNGV